MKVDPPQARILELCRAHEKAHVMGLDILRHEGRWRGERQHAVFHPFALQPGEPVAMQAGLEPGEPLTAVELLFFRERWGPYASPCWGPALSRAVWFRNTGGHKATFDFLQWHLLRALPNVYYEGFPAITVYMHDEWTNSHIASSKLVSDERTRGEPGIEFDPLPAAYVTRTTVGNPAFRDLMLELGEDEPRAKRMRKNPHVPPYQSVYESAEAPDPPPSTTEENQGPYFFK